MKYRTDIDGLRAVAVIPIVLYHAGVSAIAGGFVGVDVFFVISGFLITSIVVPDVVSGRFSLWDFYRRRATRIFPALIVVLLAVGLAGAATMWPDDLRALAKSMAAAAAFAPNLFFQLSAGYFGASAETLPLLHTWSLGVEEQFYILYPFVLLFARRVCGGRIAAVLAALAGLSLAASLALTLTAPTAAFYALPSRAWELALGGLVAVGAFPKVADPRARNALALAGLGLIAVALAVVRPTSLFPAPWALLPALGTAFVLAWGEGAVTTRLLASRPMRAIGAISYSLYLWHWPIITFWRLRTDMDLAPPAIVGVVVASLVAATASYWWVERPFLRGFRAVASPKMVVGAVTIRAAVIAVAAVLAVGAENWRTLPPEVRRVAAYATYQQTPDHAKQFLDGTCFVSLGETYDRKGCLQLSSTKPNLLVFGDSHAAQYWQALVERFPAWNVMQATGAACRPMHGVSTEGHCNDFVPYVLDHFLVENHVDAVILAGRWLDGEDAIVEATVRTLIARGIAVTVLGPIPEYQGEFPRLLADAMLEGDPTLVEAERLKERDDRDEKLAKVIAGTPATWVSMRAVECPAGKCRLFDDDGGPFHFDYGHVTLSAARALVKAVPEPKPRAALPLEQRP